MSSYPAAVDHAESSRDIQEMGGQEHPKISVILASSTSPNCTKSWSDCSCQHALVLKSMLSESSLFQFSQKKDNDSHF